MMEFTNSSHKLTILGFFTAIWFFLYMIINTLYGVFGKKNGKTDLDTKNRIASILHGLGSFSFSLVIFLTEEFK